MANIVVRLLRIASFAICLVVIASFTIFAVEQTKSASTQQQEAISGPSEHVKVSHKSGLHKAIDEASGELTSPFAGIVSSSAGEWAVHGFKLVIALLVYGFGLSYLARVLRVRV